MTVLVTHGEPVDQIVGNNFSSKPSVVEQQTITITATFTAEPIEDALVYWMRKLNIPTTIEFAPYNQIFQQVLDPTSLLSHNQQGINVLLLRFEDWQRFGIDTDQEEITEANIIQEYVSKLAQTLRTAVERSATSYLVCICPASPLVAENTRLQSFFAHMEEQLTTDLADMSSVYIVKSTEIMTMYPVSDFYDSYGDREGHIPFTSLFFSALGTLIARTLYSLTTTPYKVIALDCDQTLWQGICGEDGPEGVCIDPVRMQFQEFLVAQQKAGMLLCLCSKNNEQDVFAVFANHPDMPLKREHIVSWRINWQSKSQNLRALAEELQLSLESFIFIDDSPLECAEVQASYPEILTLPLPPNINQFPHQLQHFWAFDHLKVTDEDKKRTLLYKQQVQRQALQRESFTLEDFLTNLDVRIAIVPLQDSQLRRVAQLTQRTNQFNCTTVRRTEGEIRQFCSTDVEKSGECLTVEVSDRFGNYGLVGVLLFTTDSQQIEVDTFLLSCRVLGRGVEHRILARLGEIAQERGIGTVSVSFVPTAKNVPAREFLESTDALIERSSQDKWRFIFPTEALIGFTYKPSSQRVEFSDEAHKAQSEKGNKVVTQAAASSVTHSQTKNLLLLDIATQLNTVQQVLQAITTQRSEYLDRQEPLALPRTKTEEQLSNIWAEVFKIDEVSIYDNFFELGGSSLLAVKVSSRLNATMQVDIPLNSFFETPTIAQLAEVVERMQSQNREVETIVQRMNKQGKSEKRSLFPLSLNQQSLWFLHQLDPEDVSYNLPVFLRVDTSLDGLSLEQSIQALIQRHDTLRTTFVIVDGQPMQEIAPALSLPLVTMNIQHIGVGEQEAEVLRLATEDVRRPFDLTEGPLLRSLLLQLGPESYLLVMTFHHIIFDGWSTEVLLQELATLYNDFSVGRSASLSRLPIQYSDFALWQQAQLREGRFSSQLAYWKQQLANVAMQSELHTDRPRSVMLTSQGATYSLRLPRSLSEALKSFSKGEGVSLYMTLVAAFQTLLYRYTGQVDNVIGSVSAGRSHVESEDLIGFFVNTLVLRTDLTSDPSFRHLLEQVRKIVLEAYAHQDIPFELLVKELQPDRVLNLNPFFQVMLSFSPPQSTLLPRWKSTHIAADTGAAKFDLTLNIEDQPEGLIGHFEYRTELFDPSTIARMAGHLQVLLEAIVANPDSHVSELPLLTETERHQLLVEWNDTAIAYSQDVCLHQLVEAQVERTPDAVAVIFEQECLTYRELDSKANQLAHFLQQQGIRPDILVGVCMERSLEMVISLLAILKAGGAYVPLDPNYPPERLTYMLQDAQMPLLLSQERLQTMLTSSDTQVVCVDSEWNRIAGHSPERPVSEVEPHHLAYMIYTSGSTGKPKGAMNTHQGICNRLLWMQDAYQLQVGEGVMQKTPFSFDVSVWEFFWPLMIGARLVVARPEGHRDSAYLVELIREQRITTLHFVPSMLRIFLQEPHIETCTSLTRVICSGEALSFELQQRFFERLGAELHNLYGPTEAAVDVTYWACERNGKRLVVPIGKPIANTDLYILDLHLHPVPIGVPGELYIGGIGVGRGYLNRPELTAERFVHHPFRSDPIARLYKTGDLVRYLTDGTIEYLGRLDHQVKIRGLRIELGEIEAVLDQHPAVREVVVVAYEQEADDKSLAAYVSLHRGQQATISTLRDYMKEQLPLYMVPSCFVLLPELPLLPNGKVNRHALPKPDASITMTEGSFVAPRSMVEYQLLQLWEEVLDIRPIGIRDNFFYLGGHSLLAVRLLNRIRQAFGKKLSLSTFFAEPTIEQLAQVLQLEDDGTSQLLRPSQPSMIAVQNGGAKQPFFYLHGAYRGDGFYCFPLARLLGEDQPFYALNTHQLDSSMVPPTVEEIAATHIELICTVQPEGPYLLGGFCNGGLIVYEMARQLIERGQVVDLLVLIDPAAFGHRKRTRQIIQKLGSLLRWNQEQQVDTFLWLRHLYNYLRHIHRYLRFPEYRELKTELDLEQYNQKEGPILRWNALYELKKNRTIEYEALYKQSEQNESDSQKDHLRRIHSTLATLFPDTIFPDTYALHQDWEGLFVWTTSRYEPRSYSGKSSFLFSKGTKQFFIRRWFNLVEMGSKKVDIYFLTGTHDTWKTQHLDGLAAYLRARIAQAQAVIKERIAVR